MVGMWWAATLRWRSGDFENHNPWGDQESDAFSSQPRICSRTGDGSTLGNITIIWETHYPWGYGLYSQQKAKVTIKRQALEFRDLITNETFEHVLTVDEAVLQLDYSNGRTDTSERRAAPRIGQQKKPFASESLQFLHMQMSAAAFTWRGRLGELYWFVLTPFKKQKVFGLHLEC